MAFDLMFVLATLFIPFLIFFFIIAVVGIVVWYSIKKSRQMDEEVCDLARRFGLKYIKGSWFTSSRAEGIYLGKRHLVIMKSQRGGGNSSHPVIVFIMALSPDPRETPRHFSSFKKSLMTVSRASFFSHKRLVSASPNYNKVFNTTGEIAPKIVDSWVQQRMLELEKVAGAELHVYAPEKGKTATVAFTTTKKFIGNQMFASKVLELLDRIAEKMDRTS